MTATMTGCIAVTVFVTVCASSTRANDDAVKQSAEEALEEGCNAAIPPEIIAALMEEDAADARDAALNDPHERTGIEWMPARGRDCHSYRKRYVCEGPRRTPVPSRHARAVSERLGIGTDAVAKALLLKPPPKKWIDAVEGRRFKSLVWPVDGGKLWRGFGYVRARRRVAKRKHKGLDIGGDEGSPFRAAADGLVVYSDNGVRGYGNLIMILHRDGSLTFYGHNNANYVAAGEQVKAGQVIGEVGHTGLARGSHVHFEWRKGGKARNPLHLFPDR